MRRSAVWQFSVILVGEKLAGGGPLAPPRAPGTDPFEFASHGLIEITSHFGIGPIAVWARSAGMATTPTATGKTTATPPAHARTAFPPRDNFSPICFLTMRSMRRLMSEPVTPETQMIRDSKYDLQTLRMLSA